MKRLVFLSLLIGLLVISCERNLNSPNSSSVPHGAYSYTAYNTDGAAVVKGWFSIESSDSSAVKGEWHFQALGDSQHLGPQIGDGELVGMLVDMNLTVNLNPGWIDNNVLLNGTLSGHRIDGTWMWVTIAGPWTGGSFIAVKR